MADLEERLRASLHDRAGDVAAGPERAEAVRRRVLRRRRRRSAAPVVGAAAVVLAALAVAPTWLAAPTEVAVDPEPGEVAEDAAEAPAGTAPPEPGDEGPRAAPEPGADAAPSDGEAGFAPAEVDPLVPLERVEGLRQRLGSLALLEEDGALRVVGGEPGPVATGPPGVGPLAVAARGDGVRVAYRLGSAAAPPAGCLDVLVLRDVATGREAEVSTSCPGPAAFAPSGQQLAWIEEGATLRVVDVEGALEGDAEQWRWSLAADGDLAVRAWLGSDAGWRLVVAEATDGADRWHALPLEREDDGGLALAGDREGLPPEAALERHGLDPFALAPAEPVSVHHAEVDLLGVDEAGEARLRRGALGSEGRRDLALGGDVAAALAADDAEPWLTSQGRDTLLGDGRGGVWHVRHPATVDDTAEVTELPAAWAAAALHPGER